VYKFKEEEEKGC